ncbi:glycosyltransferase family 9 protein, partial [Escherichia coli]|uniref:glycosyltransferase family 9 protein n=1 Tax=Escherichia coli TaxID=562 RepID=UPI002542C9AC
FGFAENTDDLFVGKTLLHGDVLMWLMKTLLTSGCTNQRGAGQIAENLIANIQSETDMPIVIVHGPKGEDKARELVNSYNNVYRLSLSPSIKRSAAIIKDAYIAITPDTSILHMASAYNTPVVAIYADYKTRWPAMADVSESVVVGKKFDNISLDEFAKALKSVLARI